MIIDQVIAPWIIVAVTVVPVVMCASIVAIVAIITRGKA